MKDSKLDAVKWFSRALLFGVFAISLVLMGRQALRDIRAGRSGGPASFQERFPGFEEATDLPDERRREVARRANARSCPCRCGYTLASCLNLDLTCPERSQNLDRVRRLISDVRDGAA